MKISYFETGRYRAPETLPGQWPMPSGAYDSDAGAQVYQGMVERIEFVERLGFDWVSLSEHHYSPRILTPSPPLAAAYIAARVHTIKIALLGPIVSHSNPVRLAEELAMLDTMADGRLVVGLLRGTSNEALTYDLNPQELRDRTDEGMELILKAWTEPQPFGWQGRHFQYRTVSVWPRPTQHSASTDLRTRHQPRSRRVRSTHPYRPRRFVRAVRSDGEGDWILPRRVCAPWLGTHRGSDHFPREHCVGADG